MSARQCMAVQLFFSVHVDITHPRSSASVSAQASEVPLLFPEITQIS